MMATWAKGVLNSFLNRFLDKSASRLVGCGPGLFDIERNSTQNRQMKTLFVSKAKRAFTDITSHNQEGPDVMTNLNR